MEKKYFAYSRLETAVVTVKDGEIFEVFFSDDTPGGNDYRARREDEDEKFQFCIRNSFEIMILHNLKGYEEILEEIKYNDPVIYGYGKHMLEEHNKFMLKLKKIRK